MPAMICMATPTTHPAMIIDIHTRCGSWRSTITPTDANAENAARKVPIALSSSGVSILPTQAPSAGRPPDALKGSWRRIDAEIKADGAADHHHEQEGLIGECGMARSHQRRHEQPARRACHGKPKAFQNVGDFSNAGLHGGEPAGYGGETRTVFGEAKAT